MRKPVFIRDLAHYVPTTVLTNSMFERYLDTTADWIEQKTGIRERRALTDYDGKSPSFELARRACRRLVATGGLEPSRVGLILSACSHDDAAYPSMADRLAGELRLSVPAMHVKAACSSVVYAARVARSLILDMNSAEEILIGNGEAFTRHVDYGDRRSAILFGDAGTALAIGTSSGPFEIVDVELGGSPSSFVLSEAISNTSHWTVHDFIKGRKPSRSLERDSWPKFTQDGAAVVDYVLSTVPTVSGRFLARHGLVPERLDVVITHQANLVLMRRLIVEMGVDAAAVRYNVDRFGNTSSAGWVTVLSEQRGAIPPGASIFIVAFGAGMNWALMLLKRTAVP